MSESEEYAGSGRVASPAAPGTARQRLTRGQAAIHDFVTLYKSEMPRLVRFILKHGATPQEAADAAQTAFASAWETWEGIREPKAWLRTVALREYFRRPVQETSVECPPDEVAQPLLDSLELGEQERNVMAALATLPMKQRQVMAWHYDGFSHDQIARQMRITEQAVRQNLHRARTRLKELLLRESQEGRAK